MLSKICEYWDAAYSARPHPILVYIVVVLTPDFEEAM